MWLYTSVNVLARVLKYYAVSFCLVEGDHKPCKQRLLIHIADRLLLALLVLTLPIKISGVIIQKFDESDKKLFINVTEHYGLSLISYKALDCATQENRTRLVAVFLIVLGHILAILDETQLPCPVLIFESILSVLNIDDVLCLYCIGQTNLLLVPKFVRPCLFLLQIQIQKLVFPDTVDIAVQIN